MEQPHLEALRLALADLEAHERKEHAAALKLPLDERVAVGLSWHPLKVDTVEEAGRGRVRVRLRAPRGAVLHDGIGAGDPITLAPAGSPDAGVEGTSLGAEGSVADVLVDGPFDDDRVQAVTLRFDATTFARYRDGLVAADRKATPLRDVLLGLRRPQSDDRGPPVLAELDPSQREAAEAAVRARELALIHGPPGTGKTHVIVAILQSLVRDGDRPWALADSNAATDHVAVRAAAAGLVVVRVGHPLRIGALAEPLTLESRIARGPSARVLKDLDRELIRARSSDDWSARRKLLAERDAIADAARRAVLDSADVIASTLGTLARVAPTLPKARTAIVDEVTQAMEPAIWAAVPHVERLILVGDPRQLGPVVKQPGNPLAISLLERLLAQGDLDLPMLTVQRRMNAAIQSLVQPWYDGRLVAHPTVATHTLGDRPPLLWVDTAGAGFDEVRDPVTRSLYNDGELGIIAVAVAALRAEGVPADAIGVIAPYSAQVSRLQARPELAGVEVATVNAFQGREKEAILCSFVRSNPDGELGFVADERRLVVALSRARRYLLVTGDSTTLSTSKGFRGVMDAFQSADAWATAWEPPWSS
jgi:ATP-dependent RNA/DNA helicase IGHMBP2